MVSLVPEPETARPGHAKLADVRSIHLLQRAETLRVVGPAVHQPVVRAGMQEHVLRYRNEVLHHLRGRARDKPGASE